MHISSPVEHETFQRLVENIREAKSCCEQMDHWQANNGWAQVATQMDTMLELLYKLAERGLRQ
jgi:hypothetical protein